MTKYKHLFGPVPSRRFGRSLGIDLTPHKTCSFDCIFCQLGRTTSKTVERKARVPLDEVLELVKDKLSSAPDYITLSGSGEPTLFSQMGELIDGIKALTDVPVAVLTNTDVLNPVWVQCGALALVKVSLSVALEVPIHSICTFSGRKVV